MTQGPAPSATGPAGPGRAPRVSVIMANRNGARWLAQAIGSVLGQSMPDLELVVADDASTDDSRRIVAAMAADDRRIRLLALPAAGGAGAARNAALAAARGDWLAIMDSDDMMHPDRIGRLLGAAADLGADAVADDLLFFSTDPAAAGRTLLQGLNATGPLTLDAAMLLASDGPDPRLPSFGYLKPLIRRAALGALRYDTGLKIGEDFDLYLRLAAAGARLFVVPEPLYLYRRHAASLSHRLSAGAVAAILAAHDRFAAAQDGAGPLGPLLAARRRFLERMLRFQHLVAALKSRRMLAAARLLLADPALAAGLVQSLSDRRARRRRADDAGVARIHLRGPGAPLPGPAAGGGTVLDVPCRPSRVGHSAEPLAPLAAHLSDLAARHRLEVTAEGEDARFFAAMVPPLPDRTGAA
ncbi:MAG: glycosyltransferase family 2 protein [Rhodobacteraceae bacterium]|nr:glycosyltransferase family 2 protein [Paracoccaceae bacterium]